MGQSGATQVTASGATWFIGAGVPTPKHRPRAGVWLRFAGGSARGVVPVLPRWTKRAVRGGRPFLRCAG
eukprot:1799873-Lingulodinium_polyedra.AAC.1